MRRALSETEHASLEAAAATEQRVRVWRRDRAILLLAESELGPEQVAAALGCARASVYGWAQAWRTAGLAGLQEAPRTGRPARLLGEGTAVLEQVLASDPQSRGQHATGWTVPLLRAELADAGSDVSARTIRRTLHRRLAVVLAADPAGADLTQLFRPVGLVSHKYLCRPIVRLAELNGRAYDPAELDDLLPPLTPQPTPPKRRSGPRLPPPVGGDPPVPLTKAGLHLWHGEDVEYTPDGRVGRSASLLRIARMLHQGGLDAELITQVLAERDAALGWLKYSNRPDAHQHYERIVQLIRAGAPTRRQH